MIRAVSLRARDRLWALAATAVFVAVLIGLAILLSRVRDDLGNYECLHADDPAVLKECRKAND
jgi:hypothetical protein